MKLALQALTGCLSLAAPLLATDVSGSITTNTTWTLSGSPYVVTSTVTVSNNAQLTIEPGVVVKFNASTALNIGSGSSVGVLVAQGTPSSEILFTTNQAVQAPGQWAGINFVTTNATSRLEQCTVEFGGSGSNNTNVRIASSTPSIVDCTIHSSDGYGIFVTGASTRPFIDGNALDANGHYPLRIELLAYPSSLTANTYTGNVKQAIEMLGGSLQADATIVAQPVRYDVTSTISVNTLVAGTVTLTVQPATTLAFAASTELQLGSGANEVGVLIAQGTAAQQIVFTSSATTQAPGQWSGIDFVVTSASSTMSYCTVEYGGAGSANANVRVSSSTPSFQACAFRQSDGYGLFSGGATARPAITDCAFDSNGTLPLHVEIAGFPTTFSGNTYTGNGTQAIELAGGILSSDLALPDVGLPYHVTTMIDVYSTSGAPARLTVPAGLTIKFASLAGVQLGDNLATEVGELVAIGTPTSKITFTGTAATPGLWAGIYFAVTTPASTLDHCIVEYGGSGTNDACVRVSSSTPTIQNSTIRLSDGRGISTATSAPIVTDNTIDECATIGVYLGTAIAGSSARPVFQDNVVSDCGQRPLHLDFINYPAALSGNTYTANAIQAVEMSGGGIDSDLTIVDEGLPYDVLTTMIVNLSDTVGFVKLTIPAGITFRFAASTGLEIGDGTTERGILDARGTAAQPILFTGATATPGFWSGISFVGTTSDSVIEHATIEYGGSTSSNANLIVQHSTPRVRWCRLRNSDGYGVFLSGAVQPRINGCEITSNALGGANGTSGADLRLNWWGDASGPSGAGPGSGQSVSTGPVFEPWLAALPTPSFEWSAASPNWGDPFTQSGGSTSFLANASQAADWTLELRDAGSTLVKSFTGSGAQASATWLGDGAGGAPVPNGTYSWELAATVAGGGATAATARGTATTSSTLLLAAITSPTPDQFVAGTIPVVGTASGAGFATYRVEHGVGYAPTAWTTITTSSSQVVAGTLATWNASTLTAPVYTLRLTVTPTAGAPATVLVPVKVVATGTLVVTPPEISPNGNGFDDVARITCAPSHPLAWTVTIRNGGGATVRTFTGTGGTVDVDWDGRDSLGVVVPDGGYTCQLTGTVVGGSVNVASATVPVLVDTVMPVAAISSPTEGQVILTGPSTPIIGTATDLNFFRWELRRGTGINPTSFTLLTSGSSPVSNGTFYTQSWGTLANGVYTYRLTVIDDAANTTEIDRHITLDRLEITNVARTAGVIQPHVGETTSFTYTINHAADVTLQVYRYSPSTLVRTIVSTGQLAGANSIQWDGRDDLGALLPLEAYHPVISAVDTFGGSDTYSSSTSPPAGPLPATSNYAYAPTTFNPYANEDVSIVFDFSQIGRMTLHVRQINNTLIRTLLQSTPIASGSHEYLWDGRADNGSMYQGSFEVYWGVPQTLPEAVVLLTAPSSVPGDAAANAWLIHPLFGEISSVSYELAAAANVTITIKDPNGNTVRTLQTGVLETAGTHVVEWDGQNDVGKYTELEGSYRVRIATVDAGSGAQGVRELSILLYRS